MPSRTRHCACPSNGAYLCGRCTALLARAQQGCPIENMPVEAPRSPEEPSGPLEVSLQPPHLPDSSWTLVACLRLPWPPSLNHLYPTGRDGRRHLSARGRQYHHAVAAVVACTRGQTRCLTGRLAVQLDCYPPDRRVRHDLDNLPKIILDSLTQAGLLRDDSQVDMLTVTRQRLARGGSVVVSLRLQTTGFALPGAARTAPCCTTPRRQRVP